MKEKINLLITNGHLKVGGVEKSLISLLQSIDYSKFHVDLLLFEDYGEYYEHLPKEVNVILFDLKPYYGSFKNVLIDCVKRRDLKGIYIKSVLMLSSKISIKIITLLKYLNIVNRIYDFCIAYRVEISNDFISFCVKAKKKYMWWHHGEFDYNETIVNRWNQSLKNIDEIVCVSEYTKKMIDPYFPNKKRIIPNILMIDEIIKKSILFNPYMNENSIIVVSVGRMSPEKMMINPVYAMKKLLQKGYCNVKWYLIGDGIEKKQIEEEIKKNNLDNHVICVGNQSNPYPYIKFSDFFVHPSYVESQGISVLEAMVLGKCGVVTYSGGTSEFVVDGKNAIVAEQNVESLVDRVEYVLNHLELINEFACYQKETARKYSYENIMNKFYDLFK